MEILIEQLTDDSDDLRDLCGTLGREPAVDSVEEVRPPVPEGALGGELAGLLVHLAPEVCTALTSVLVAWLHTRRSRLRLTLKRHGNDLELTLNSDNDPKDSTAAVESFIEAARKATETADSSVSPGDSA
ncbi:effector-associated constant component EACC1 [Streptomyces mirabilis]|uniref:effector-associated constant component EACC1 n=1 Tax=Streptomyces mirabilis TaxID=68239 RepID=UPI0036CED72F